MQTKTNLLAVALLAATAGMAQAVSLTASGYSETFDSMSTTGTTRPAGWSVYTGPSGSNNNTWGTSITASGVAALIATTGPLTATNNPTTTQNNGFNAAFSTSSTLDRVLATSPTTTSGGALALTLTNNSGFSFSDLLVSYDTRRFTSVSSANQLPGYQLFYSLNNTSWTNVAALNPTLATVTNTVGVTSVTNATVNLGSSVGIGSNVYLRWVDDNALQTSPDQIIGLNNVSIAPVPEPEHYAMLLAGLGIVGAVARRRRS